MTPFNNQDKVTLSSTLTKLSPFYTCINHTDKASNSPACGLVDALVVKSSHKDYMENSSTNRVGSSERSYVLAVEFEIAPFLFNPFIDFHET